MNKVVFILLDALTREGASKDMGFLQSLVESGDASYVDIKGELPSLSRPCYESILTGTPVSIHHIAANNITMQSPVASIFSIAHENGLITAAASYHWISELYNTTPFNPATDRVTNDEKKNIQHGIFYFDDTYPDTHLFLDGESLRSRYSPDFLLIHPMGIDYTGHMYGGHSREYEKKCVEIDSILANFIPLWLASGYSVIVTSDHGMSEFGNHGGNREAMRNVFAYFIGCGKEEKDIEYSQLSLAPTVCRLLNLKPAQTMKAPQIALS